MLLSMTGYGRSGIQSDNKSFQLEIRALNSKVSDLRLKIPNHYKEKENELRKIISEKTERGKIEFSLEISSTSVGDQTFLNTDLFKKYYASLLSIADELKINTANTDIIQTILKMPNVVVGEFETVDQKEWELVQSLLNECLENLAFYRKNEGAVMEEDLRLKLNSILQLLSEIKPFEESRILKIKHKIAQHLEEITSLEQIDKNRFEQEIIYYLEKLDINEEKLRLEQNCLHFLEVLSTIELQKGRKLNFISQEIGREINTLGAKANSSEIQKLVVNMKDELEKIKELLANVL
jgi:uncharacterized protein (TIGR00255 family)